MAKEDPFKKLNTQVGRSEKDLIANDCLVDKSGTKIDIFRYNGHIYPPFGDLAISKIKDTEIRDEDVFLGGYPKTGSHWMFQILSMVIQRTTKGGGIGKTEGFLEKCAPDVVKAQPSPRILNSHVTFDDLPTQMYSKKTKIVLTVRNPKDTIVSYYNHQVQKGYNGKFEDYFHLFLDGTLEYDGYFNHYADWQKALQDHPDHPILVMSFEDMKEDLPREIRRLAKFLNVDLDDTLVEDIAKAAGFENMVKTGRIMKMITRKGQVGDWKNWLTVTQNELMDAVIDEKMSDWTFYTPRYTLP